MKTYLTKAELKLMEVIWEKGQIPSNKLVKECLERFNRKKSTTYTNLKKLVDKKIDVITNYFKQHAQKCFIDNFEKNASENEKKYKDVIAAASFKVLEIEN